MEITRLAMWRLELWRYMSLGLLFDQKALWVCQSECRVFLSEVTWYNLGMDAKCIDIVDLRGLWPTLI